MAPLSDSAEPKSWGELLQSYRSSFGSQSYTSCSAVGQQVRFARSVPTVCPLAETTHPLYAVGSSGQHAINPQDGSQQRSQWHGWGDVSLLKQEGPEGQQQHPRGAQPRPKGKRFVPAPCKEGRNGLFGLLQGTEAGGPDAWLGHPQIDPTKGKRAVSPPTDPKRAANMTALLAQTAPGAPSADAWLGNIQIDPAKGKGHAPDPCKWGRPDLFRILQQKILQEGNAGVCSSSSGGGAGGGGCSNGGRSGSNGSSGGSSNGDTRGSGGSTLRSPADADAWLGNRLIQPNKGKKSVDDSPASAAHIHAATFKGPPPAEGCWCDLPPIGKRPLSPPSNARNFVTAAQTMAVEVPLPSGTIVGAGKLEGRTHFARPYSATNMYSLMTFKPLTPDESGRCTAHWNDAAKQPRRKPVASSAAGGSHSWQQLLAAAPAQPVRFVPFGGIAQERGMTLDAIIANRKHLKRG